MESFIFAGEIWKGVIMVADIEELEVRTYQKNMFIIWNPIDSENPSYFRQKKKQSALTNLNKHFFKNIHQ